MKSKGKGITVLITPPDGYDAADIRKSTISLNGEVAARQWPTAIIRGSNRLMIKMDRQAVADILEGGTGVEIHIAGEMTDGIPFEASDAIRVK